MLTSRGSNAKKRPSNRALLISTIMKPFNESSSSSAGIIGGIEDAMAGDNLMATAIAFDLIARAQTIRECLHNELKYEQAARPDYYANRSTYAAYMMGSVVLGKAFGHVWRMGSRKVRSMKADRLEMDGYNMMPRSDW